MPHAFLFEFVEGAEKTGRWSLLGIRPRRVHRWRVGDPGDPFTAIRADLAAARRVAVAPGLPPFAGGWVGHVSYDAVRLFEPRVPIARADEVGFADVCLYDFDEVVAFDNAQRSLQLIVEVRGEEGDDPRRLHADAAEWIQHLAAKLARPLAEAPRPVPAAPTLTARTPRRPFLGAVRRAKAAIAAGDCQQIVVSQRFDASTEVEPFALYRSLRRINPSPYQFFLREDQRTLVGGSPETLVSLRESELRLRAMELIERLEPARRGPYAGCVGYFDRGGAMETWITIRTVCFRPGAVSIKAGAGTVHDSVPAREYEETVNKAGAMFAAIEAACTGHHRLPRPATVRSQRRVCR